MIRLRCKWPYEPWSCSCCGARIEGRAPSSVLAGLACDECLERGRKGEPYVPLTVRPSAPARRLEDRPIVAVSMADGRVALESTLQSGQVFDLEQLPDRIRPRKPGEVGGHRYKPLPEQLPPAIVVTDDSLELLGFLEHSQAADAKNWNWQVSVREQGSWRPEARSQRRFLVPRPMRFGYPARGGGKRKKSARWYLLLEPGSFCELPDGWGRLDAIELLRFAIELRAWANRNQLPFLTGISSYGSRLLRDSRFESGWRRKVPQATNDRLRRRLPGNHYQLLAGRDMTHGTAHKWDQASAHHYAALKNRFPHADLLDVAGWFRRTAPHASQPFEQRGPIRAGSERWRELLARPGAFVVGVSVPELVAIDPLQPPALRRAGRTWQLLYSPEIEYVRRLGQGVRLLDIWCAWTSPEEDVRLREYALWSGEQLAQVSGSTRRWVKPLLLAAYGMLAVRPHRFRNAWRYCANPDGAVGWQTSHGQLLGFERSTKHDREPATTNVLWRAIIESAVRLESLRWARQLRAKGGRPIAIYADAVFATGGPPLGWPDPPAPWRYEGEIHDLTFDSPARYRSREEVRLPGTPRQRGGLRPALPHSFANDMPERG